VIADEHLVLCSDTCVIFTSWHISSNFTMLISWSVPASQSHHPVQPSAFGADRSRPCLSCSAVVALIAFGYELLQSRVRAYDRKIAASLVVSHPGLVGGSGRSSPEPGEAGGGTTYPTSTA
jgi:hypothetical protein